MAYNGEKVGGIIMKGIHLKSTSLMVTERCTLKCKLCLSYTPYYKNPVVLRYTDAKNILQRYFELIDYVDKFAITGGEPLTNKDLLQIIQLIYTYKHKFGELILITNGTMDWPEGLLDVFKSHKDKAKIIINNYGANLSKNAIKIYKEALTIYDTERENEKYKDEKIILYHEENRYGWIDCRNHEKKHNETTVKTQAESCAFYQGKKYIIDRGELHLCTRSFYRILEGIIPKNTDEYLDLLAQEYSLEHAKEQIIKMQQLPNYTSCHYCEGLTNTTRKYPAAEQLN